MVENFYDRGMREAKERDESQPWKNIEKIPITIPNALCNPDFRFILVGRGQKNPLEQGWQKKANYVFDDPKLIDHLAKGGNYGVVTGYGSLTVLDIDDESIFEELRVSLPDTFIVETGSGKFYKRHYYYLTEPHADSFKILDAEKNTLVDIQSKGKQVIGPGSLHNSGGFYTVKKDIPIQPLSMAEIHAILAPWMKDDKKQSVQREMERVKDTIIEQVKKRVKVSDLLSEYGINTSKNPTDCPLHSSKGGKCLSFDDNRDGGVWNCFHCGKGGDIFTLLMEQERIRFPQAKEKLAERAGVSMTERQYTAPIEDSPWIERYEDKNGNEKIRIDYKFLVIEYQKAHPFFYDSRTGLLWWWEHDKYVRTYLPCVIDDIDCEMGIPVLNDTVNSHNQYYVHAIYQVGQRSRPKDIPKTWVYFEDCAYDVKNGSRIKPTPEYFFANPIPWKVGSSSETPHFDKLFGEWVDVKDIPILYEIIAYCCLPDYPLARIFCLTGGGSNGKSVFLSFVGKFVGHVNVTSTELDLLADNRFEIAKLYRKHVCLMGETNFTTISKTALLKWITGNDLISFEFKNKDPFEGYNYAKILIATNSLPMTDDKSDGFYRRWIIINWPNRFDGTVDPMAGIPDSEYEALATKCIEVLSRLLTARHFSGEGDIEHKMQVYEETSDPLTRFLKDECDFSDPDAFVTKFDFRDRLGEWLTKRRYRVLTNTELGRAMKDRGVEEKRMTVEVLVENPAFLVMEKIEKRYWCWVGLSFYRRATDDSGKTVKTVKGSCTRSPNDLRPLLLIEASGKCLDSLDSLAKSDEGSTENMVISEDLVEDSPPLYMKCHICGADPCVGYDNRPEGKGQPICADCNRDIKK